MPHHLSYMLVRTLCSTCGYMFSRTRLPLKVAFAQVVEKQRERATDRTNVVICSASLRPLATSTADRLSNVICSSQICGQRLISYAMHDPFFLIFVVTAQELSHHVYVLSGIVASSFATALAPRRIIVSANCRQIS